MPRKIHDTILVAMTLLMIVCLTAVLLYNDSRQRAGNLPRASFRKIDVERIDGLIRQGALSDQAALHFIRLDQAEGEP